LRVARTLRNALSFAVIQEFQPRPQPSEGRNIFPMTTPHWSGFFPNCFSPKTNFCSGCRRQMMHARGWSAAPRLVFSGPRVGGRRMSLPARKRRPRGPVLARGRRTSCSV